MQDHDWLFDVVLDLCEKAEQNGLPAMSAKLEEALDAYLEDAGNGGRTAPARDKEVASFGPISLGQESYVFGGSRSAQSPPPKGSATGGEGLDDNLQEVRFIRSPRNAGRQGDGQKQEDIPLDKAG